MWTLDNARDEIESQGYRLERAEDRIQYLESVIEGLGQFVAAALAHDGPITNRDLERLADLLGIPHEGEGVAP